MSDTETRTETNENVADVDKEPSEKESSEKDFSKILSDFVKDLLNTFPELDATLDDDLRKIYEGIDCDAEQFERVKNSCKIV